MSRKLAHSNWLKKWKASVWDWLVTFKYLLKENYQLKCHGKYISPTSPAHYIISQEKWNSNGTFKNKKISARSTISSRKQFFIIKILLTSNNLVSHNSAQKDNKGLELYFETIFFIRFFIVKIQQQMTTQWKFISSNKVHKDLYNYQMEAQAV